MREVYKVIYLEGKKKLSASRLLGLPDDLVIQYRAKRWIKPRVGKIFCFNSLHHALSFSYMNTPVGTSIEIWRCKAKGAKKLTKALDLWDISHLPSFMDIVARFWKGSRSVDIFTGGVPSGTLVARELKLEQRVYPVKRD